MLAVERYKGSREDCYETEEQESWWGSEGAWKHERETSGSFLSVSLLYCLGAFLFYFSLQTSFRVFRSCLWRTWLPTAAQHAHHTPVNGRDSQESLMIPSSNHPKRRPGWLELSWVVEILFSELYRNKFYSVSCVIIRTLGTKCSAFRTGLSPPFECHPAFTRGLGTGGMTDMLSTDRDRWSCPSVKCFWL